MEHVLLCTLGRSHAVVTETLWAMMNPDDARYRIVCSTVVVLTTAAHDDKIGAFLWDDDHRAARDRAREDGTVEDGWSFFASQRRLLHDRICELYEETGEEAPAISYLPVRDEDGAIIPDVSDQEQNRLFADEVMRQVLRQVRRQAMTGPVADPIDDLDLKSLEKLEDNSDVTLHVSLAGGRKSMSSYAHTALMFFGRPRDQLSHVLIMPPELEDPKTKFWWPGKHGAGAKSVVPRNQAIVKLIDVPFIPMRLTVPKGVTVEDLKYREFVELGKLIEEDRVAHNGPPPVEFDADNFSVISGTIKVKLSPAKFIALALFAVARKASWKTDAVDGKDGDGWINTSPSRTSARIVGTVDEVKRLQDSFDYLYSYKYQAPKKLNSFVEIDSLTGGEKFRASYTPARLIESMRKESLYLASRIEFEAIVTNNEGSYRRSYRLCLPPDQIVLKGFSQQLFELPK